jgi:GntR family transcriptional repressor for pyruvate dehydrogenase complex
MAEVVNDQIESPEKLGTLADRVTGILMDKIRSNEFPANSRLPSEFVMAKQFGVSRTVIREAISRLKSEGLVGTRKGSGTIVLEPNLTTPFRIDIDLKDSIQAVLRVIELRRGLEAEMAALAAERRTEAQNARIKKALADIRKAERAGRDGVDEDIKFHTAISEASGNPLYTSLLTFLSQFLRVAICVTRTNEARREDFRRQVSAEHAALADAISLRNSAAARAAALQHMENAAARIHAADAEFWASEGGKAARNFDLSKVPSSQES